jgi:hypothetical protein
MKLSSWLPFITAFWWVWWVFIPGEYQGDNEAYAHLMVPTFSTAWAQTTTLTPVTVYDVGVAVGGANQSTSLRVLSTVGSELRLL